MQPLPQKPSITSIFPLFKKYIRWADLLFIAIFIPVISLYLIIPDTFKYNWGGRGGLLFALLFIGVEWLEARNTITFKPSRKTYIGATACIIGILTYYGAVSLVGFSDSILQFGKNLNLPEPFNFPWVVDYSIFAAYFIGITASLFGFRGIKRFPISILYILGMTLLMLLDVLFPYSSMELLQAIVPTILYFLTMLLEKAGVPFLIAQGNILLIWGKEGLLALAIYWPCAGVHSMLIYLLVITVVMMKIGAPLIRKLVYVVSGAVGTFFVNILRLFLVCYYGAFISNDVWLFHETIGEILFLTWIILFIITIILIERRLASIKLNSSKTLGLVQKHLP